VARFSPWHLYAGADALHRGIDPLLLAIALAAAAALFGASFVGLRRRDLRV